MNTFVFYNKINGIESEIQADDLEEATKILLDGSYPSQAWVHVDDY